MTDYLIPRPDAAFSKGGTAPTKQWYDFLHGLYDLYQSSDAGVQEEITALCYKLGSPDGTIANIPPIASSKVQGIDSIVSNGFNIVQLRLDGDVLNAEALTFYGAIDALSKGWQYFSANFQKKTITDVDYLDLVDITDSGEGSLLAITIDGKGRVIGSRDATITGTAGNITVAHGDASDGLPTINLATVADVGGGSLVKIDRDSFGRVAGTSTPTTDDLAEGSTNLYFTAERAEDAVGGILDGTGNVPLTYDDAGNKISAALSSGVLASLALADSSVQGPASSVDGDAVLFNGTTGKLIKDGGSFGSLVRSAVLTGLSLATSAVIAATDNVLGAFGKLQAQITDNLIPKGYIDGLEMQWVSGTALTVTSGSAYIEGSSNVLRATSTIAKTGLSLSASTWYHVYLYDNAGTPDVEVSTTAPASPYNGTARSKTGDASRRYLGSVRSLASGGIAAFDMFPNGLLLYRSPGSNTFRLLFAGTATTITDIDVSSLAPVTARLGYFRFQVNGGSYTYLMPGGATSTDQADLVASMGASVGLGTGFCRFNSVQKISYAAHDTSTPTYIWIYGYLVER
jgi:hypothetical protein